MDLISRISARLLGAKMYFTGDPCIHGHIAERRVSNGRCAVCANDQRRTDEKRARRTASRHEKLKLSPPPKRALSPRKAAKEQGLLHYVSKRPCPNGHSSVRFVTSGACYQCVFDRTQTEEAKELSKMRAAVRRATPKGKANTKAYKQARRARYYGSEGTHTKQDILRIFEKQGGKCACCRIGLKAGRSLNYHADHIMPLALGGSNWAHNIQLLCPPCNLSKGAKHPADWAKLNGMLI